MPREGDRKTLRCSFCGKSQAQVQRLIAGNDAYICDECVHLCLSILGDEFEDDYPEFTREGETAEKLMDPKDVPSPRRIKAALGKPRRNNGKVNENV